jgi:hypothetical protein
VGGVGNHAGTGRGDDGQDVGSARGERTEVGRPTVAPEDVTMPSEDVAETELRPAGNLSVTAAPVAGSGLAPITIKEMFWPARTQAVFTARIAR